MRTPNRCLRRAIKKGDTSKIVMLLNRLDINLKALDDKRNTVLHHVLQNERWAEKRIIEILKIFLRRRVDPNSENCRCETVLNLAIARRMKGVVNILIEYNADISKVNIFYSDSFIENESKKFWETTSADEESTMRNREIMEIESASFFKFLLSLGLNFDVQNIHYLKQGRCRLNKTTVWTLHSAIRHDLLHIVPVMLQFKKCKNYFEDKTLLHTLFQADDRRRQRPISPAEASWYANYRQRYVPRIVKTLLDQGFSVLATDKHGLTPLCAALKNEEDISTIKVLINHFPDGCDKISWATSLLSEMISAKWSDSRITCYSEILDDLIVRGADVDYQSRYGRSSIHQAIRARNVAGVKYLRDVGINLGIITKYGNNLLHLLAEKNLAQDFCQETEEAMFDLLVSEGCQVDAKNVTGFMVSAKEANWYGDYRRRYVPGIVETLLDRGVSAVAMDEHGVTPLGAALENEEDVCIIELLVNHVPDNCDESSLATSLFCEMARVKWSDSRIEGYLKILDDLMARGANVDFQDESGMRPVHRAVSAGNSVPVGYLKEKGADFCACTKSGDNLMHLLAQNETEESVMFNLLVSKGCCSLDAANASGNTPLHVAANCGNLSLVRKLIDHGAEVNCKNNESQTPLYIAAALSLKKENIDVLRLLCSRGAHLDVRDNNGDSALAKAMRNEKHLNALELVAQGANINSSHILNCVASLRGTISCDYMSRHWLKMRIAKLPCLKDYENVFGNSKVDELQQFHQTCLKEIKTLKDTFIDSYTSFYRFLRLDPNSRCIHLNNERFKSFINSSKLKEKFPQYADLISASYHVSVARKILLEPANEAWLELTKISLPDICVKRILAYLTNEDLGTLIEQE